MGVESLEFLKTEVQGNVAIITLNRPKALNALCQGLRAEFSQVISAFEEDDNIHVIIVTGNQTAFAAGADINEIANYDFVQLYNSTTIDNCHDFAKVRKPTIAAVNGFALGGCCELAIMCDIIIAGDKAKFGLPEVKLGTIPGAGGTQRLVCAIGKAKAMHLVLTGDTIDAHEAERDGLVSKVVPADKLLEEALAVANKIAAHSLPITRMAKEAVNASFELSLQESLRLEDRLFRSTSTRRKAWLHDALSGFTARRILSRPSRGFTSTLHGSC